MIAPNNDMLSDNSEHPKKAAMLAAYAECGVVSRAAKAADVGRTTHYEWLLNDENYAAAFEEAHKYAIEAMEAEARRRAIEGWDEPVFHEGHVCGHKRKFSDTLLIFMLKGALPEKYREQITSEDAARVTNQQINIYLPANGREAINGQLTNGHDGNGKH